MWQYADQLIDAFVDDGSCEFVEPVRRAVHADRHRRPRGRARIRPLAVPRPPVDGARRDRPQAAGVPLRALQRVHRGPPPEPTRRRPDRSGDRHLPGRLDAGGEGCGADRRQPLRRRAGDDRPAADLRACECSPSGPTCRSWSATTATGSRTSSRRRCGSRARCAPSSGWRGCRTTLGGVEIPAGATLMLAPGACNRDQRVFDDPARVRHRARQRAAAHRVRARHPHLRRCAARPRRRPGHAQPVPRPDHATSRSRRAEHGPAGDRRYEYLPTFFLRGLQRLHLEFTPAADRAHRRRVGRDVDMISFVMRVAAGRPSCRRRSASRCR